MPFPLLLLEMLELSVGILLPFFLLLFDFDLERENDCDDFLEELFLLLDFFLTIMGLLLALVPPDLFFLCFLDLITISLRDG